MSIFDEQDRCCAGAAPAAPRHNRPGLKSIAYRVDTHGGFREAMLADLSRAPALRRLTTREDDDATVALIDAWATVLDVLTFYQERIANEGFLRTATERRSVLELARAIGYELNPGVAAFAWLAFTVEASPGAADTVAIDPGLKVQSIPGQDEQPQTFETIGSVSARPEYNAMRPRLTKPQTIGRATTQVFLEGVSTGLSPGDLLLLVGQDREADPYSERWDVRTVRSVTPVAAPGHAYTLVTWEVELGHTAPRVDPAQMPTVHAFRRRASLFGFNAPDWRAMPEPIRDAFDPDGSQVSEWPDFEIQTVAQRRIDLDAVYAELLAGSWVLLDKPGYRELYRAEKVFTDARRDYTLTAKTTSLILDNARHLSFFPLRESSVHTASEELPRAERPVSLPVFGERLELDGSLAGLEAGRALLVCGSVVDTVIVAPRRRVLRTGADEIETQETALELLPLDGSAAIVLGAGEALLLEGPPRLVADGDIEWTLRHDSGVVGTVLADEDDLLIGAPADDGAPAFAPASNPDELCEVVTVAAVDDGGPHTLLELAEPLTRVYHRTTVVVHGNVVAATHGEARAEVVAALSGDVRTETLGSGDGGASMQRFRLTQAPLTYVTAATPSGGRSTLEVRVDGLLWKEVATLYGQPGDARVYATRAGADGVVTVEFGDGRHGARLPTGRDNVTATYRIGTGVAGNVRKGQLALLMSRPLGLKEVTNPLAADGAEDPESSDAARANAPLTVLTLDRIVSARDFEDFARAFAGISKAQATVLWNGERELVHITVAGVAGAAVAPGSTTCENLREAVDAARHTDQEVRIDSYRALSFGLAMRLVVEDAFEIEPVLEAVRGAIAARYGFAARAFAEAVAASQIAAVAQDVVGVRAVLLDAVDGADPVTRPVIPARRARWDATRNVIDAAELLTVDAGDVRLEGLRA